MLLHGFGGNCESLNAFIDRFSDYKIFAPNLHSIETKILCLNDYSLAVVSFLRSNNVSNANFIVHSFGARVVCKINEIDSALINKVMFIGAAGIKPRFNLLKWLKIKTYKIAKKMKLKCANNFGSKDYKNLSIEKKQTF